MDCGVLVGACLIQTVSGGVVPFSGGRAPEQGVRYIKQFTPVSEPSWYESPWWASLFLLLAILVVIGLVIRICWAKRRYLKERRSTIKKDIKIKISKPPKHNGTLIFLHGIGDTGDGWKRTLKTLRPPHVKIICPTAKKMPVTLNSGFKMPAWYDLTTYDSSGSEDEAGIKKAVQIVSKIIEEEIKIGIPSERIVIGGFSQGGALAFYTALHTQYKLGGVIGLSCWMPLRNDLQSRATHATEANLDTPFMQVHGDADGVVSSSVGLSTSVLLKKMLVNHEFKIYNKLAHETSDQEMRDVMNFVSSCLPTIDPYADA